MDQLAEYRARQQERFAERQQKRLEAPDVPSQELARPSSAGDSGSFEMEIIKQINAVRTSPSACAAAIRKRLCHTPPNEAGAEACAEAIEFLEGHPPSGAVRAENVRMLRLAAEDHRVDLAAHAADGHWGSDGSSLGNRVARYGRCFGASAQIMWFGSAGATAAEIVQDLILDETAPSRLQLLEASHLQVGVAYGPHNRCGACAVLVFAEGCLEDGSRAALREMQGPQVALNLGDGTTAAPPPRLDSRGSSSSGAAEHRPPRSGGAALRAVSAARAVRSAGGVAPAAAWPGHSGGSHSRERRHGGSSSLCGTPKTSKHLRRAQSAVNCELPPFVAL